MRGEDVGMRIEAENPGGASDPPSENSYDKRK